MGSNPPSDPLAKIKQKFQQEIMGCVARPESSICLEGRSLYSGDA